MGFKTISLSDEAYNALKKKKLKGESFNDLVLRLVSEPKQDEILSLSGLWKGSEEETESILEGIYNNRKTAVLRKVEL
jgi:predicted CopG family antitoxin